MGELGQNPRMNRASTAQRLSMSQVLLCGGAIVTLSMGIRHGFGLWLQPMTIEHGWSRETFAFALAVQNLAWGLASPFAGMLADRFGAFRVLVGGGLCYALGLVLMGLSTSGLAFTGSAGLLLGMAQAGTTYAVVFGVIARQVDPARRSWAMGMTAATGSFGQFLMVPTSSGLISGLGWQEALFILGAACLAILPLARGLREPPFEDADHGPPQSIGAALREAFGYRSFQLLTLGYFVCGFQVVFIGIHLPSHLQDQGLTPDVATAALALIGLFNVFGTYFAGVLGQQLAKRHLLSAIYLLRSAALVTFVLTPISAWTVYVFAATMGLLWLSTVPLTNALVAQMFGARYMSMLGGIVFLSHQVGSFLGGWLGGLLYDRTGSYDVVWWIAIALGVAAAVVNQPVRETAIERSAAQAA